LKRHIPKELPPGIEQLRILRTDGYLWKFWNPRTKEWQSYDIRTPGGRLEIHDLLKPECTIDLSNGRIYEVKYDSRTTRQPSGAKQNKRETTVETNNKQEVGETSSSLETAVGQMEIAERCTTGNIEKEVLNTVDVTDD
jgi:hypothetical protein